MIISGQRELIIEAPNFRKTSYAALRELSVACILTKTDRRAMADHIQTAVRIGVGIHLMLARLLSKKLLYAAVVQSDAICPTIAIGGSRVTYAIDDLAPQTGRLFQNDEYACGQNGIHVATLLGATLIGMKAGTHAPFLQADGSFRKLRLISVDYHPPVAHPRAAASPEQD